MQDNHTTTTPAAKLAAVSPKPTASQKLESARQHVRTAARSIQVNEGRLLDYDTCDEIGRTLSLALCELRELAITLAVMERKETRINA